MLLTEKNLKKFIEYHHINAEIIEFDESVMKSQEASKLVSDGIVAKSIVLISDGEPVICILEGSRRIDLEKVKNVLGSREVGLAKAKEVKKEVGYDVGGVPPFGHLKRFLTIVDSKLLEKVDETFYMGGGSHHHLLKIKGKELLNALEQLTTIKIADVSQP